MNGLCWISDPQHAYIPAQITEVEDGIVQARAEDNRSFVIDLEAPLAPKTRKKQKEEPRRILQRTIVDSASVSPAYRCLSGLFGSLHDPK